MNRRNDAILETRDSKKYDNRTSNAFPSLRLGSHHPESPPIARAAAAAARAQVSGWAARAGPKHRVQARAYTAGANDQSSVSGEPFRADHG